MCHFPFRSRFEPYRWGLPNPCTATFTEAEGGPHSCRLRLRQQHHQSDRKRAHPVLSKNLFHVEFLSAMPLPTGQYALKNRWLQEK